VIDPFSVNIDWIPPSPEHPVKASTISFTFRALLEIRTPLARIKQ